MSDPSRICALGNALGGVLQGRRPASLSWLRTDHDAGALPGLRSDGARSGQGGLDLPPVRHQQCPLVGRLCQSGLPGDRREEMTRSHANRPVRSPHRGVKSR